MRNLLLFFQKYNYWFLFVILELLSFVLMFQYNTYQGSVYFTSANEVSGCIYNMQSQVLSYFSLTKVNKELTEQNVQLSLEISQLKESIARSADSLRVHPSMRLMLDTMQSIPASVVHVTTNRKNNFITINKGESDGLRPDMGVVGGNGLVGVVYQTTSHFALVLPAINTLSSISCRIRSRSYLGNLRWDGADMQHAMLEDVPRHAKFRKGDLVETSGYSTMFPAGILVGKIVAIYNSDDGLSYELKVQLATDFGRLRDVLVLPSLDDPELDVLQDRVYKIEKEAR